jgi:lipoprotein-anchoring transpeptidase ErfK/SrfK
MLFRSALLTAIVLSSLAGPGDKSHAQYYPSPGYYDPPPQAYPRQPNRPVQSFEGEDDPDYGIGPVRRGPPDPDGADLRVTGSTRGDVRSFAALPPEVRPEVGPAKELPSQFRRTLVDYYTREPAGTIVVDTPNTYLYFVLGNGKALRYGIGVGREGFTWSGSEKVSRMAEWPDWNPPEQMIERQPYLPRFMAGGDGNPLGARALYLGDTLFRIHGTNQPSTIGTFVSSGCIRLKRLLAHNLLQGDLATEPHPAATLASAVETPIGGGVSHRPALEGLGEPSATSVGLAPPTPALLSIVLLTIPPATPSLTLRISNR